MIPAVYAVPQEGFPEKTGSLMTGNSMYFPEFEAA